MTQLLDDSESNSDADNLFQQYHRSLNSGRGVDLSTDDSDHESLNGSHQHQSLDLGSSAVGGMESILDSLEIRRHWNFLNSSGISENVETGTGESSKEDEDDMCRFIGMLCLHPLFLIILLSFAQVWSLWLSIMKFVLPTSDSSPSPPSHRHRNNSTDFAFPHHLSLPVDAGHDPDDEVVFPSSPRYSWTDQLNGRGRALQLNIGSGMLQLSIQPNPHNAGEEDTDVKHRRTCHLINGVY